MRIQLRSSRFGVALDLFVTLACVLFIAYCVTLILSACQPVPDSARKPTPMPRASVSACTIANDNLTYLDWRRQILRDDLAAQASAPPAHRHNFDDAINADRAEVFHAEKEWRDAETACRKEGGG